MERGDGIALINHDLRWKPVSGFPMACLTTRLATKLASRQNGYMHDSTRATAKHQNRASVNRNHPTAHLQDADDSATGDEVTLKT